MGKYGRTDGHKVCVFIGRKEGLAKWINYYYFLYFLFALLSFILPI